MQTKQKLAWIAALTLLIGVSVVARDPVPLFGGPVLDDPPRLLVIKSGGEVIARLTPTNWARVHLPDATRTNLLRMPLLTGIIEVVNQNSIIYRNRGKGTVTVKIESESGHSVNIVGEEFEIFW